ncbi:DUF5134 domain-containing protein [Jiangella muralis]|uniref:DUF5134 domain-containing protein n=1 Tax=Jiangella muralis TaxID=702383 RepID=UPI0014704696|nr:DUF5134 domain-containing protein [Jiangella muralis]
MTRRGRRTGLLAADVPDLSHALMGVAMALMVSPAGEAVPPALGIAAFTVLAAWFGARLRHDGLLGRATLPAVAGGGGGGGGGSGGACGCDGPTSPHGGELGHTRAATGRLTGLDHRDNGDDPCSGHSGYHLHHLVGCVAMVVMYLTGHGTLAAHAIAAAATTAEAGAAATGAAPEAVALDLHGAHAGLPALVALCWVFGLYFLVAATSLGFRVGERTSPEPPPARPPRPTTARVLTSQAGACATEVALSAGMAVLFFSAL